MSEYDDESPWGDDPGQQADPLDELAAASEGGSPQGYAPAYGSQPGPAMDGHQRLDTDLSCRGCGYNLRGLGLGQTCPECGMAVDWSAQGDLLQYANVHWLGKLKQGMTWYIVAIFATIGLAIVNGVISMALQAPTNFQPSSSQQSGQPTFNQMMPQSQGSSAQLAVTLVIGMISAAMFVIAVWMLTTPEPGQQEDSPMNARSLFRWGWIIGAALTTAANTIMLANVLVAMGVSLAGMIPSLVAYFAMFVYLRRLALRVPDAGLAGQTRTVMWGIVASYGVMIVAALAMLIAMVAAFSSSSGGSGPGAGLAAGALIGIGGVCLAGLGILVFGIWGLVLTFLYRARFARCEAFARRSGHSPATYSGHPSDQPY